MKETSRKITQEEHDMLVKLSSDDIDLELLKDLFSFRLNKEPRFQPFDVMTLKKDEYYNQTTIKTTVGRFIFNKLVLGDGILKYLGYLNVTLDKGNIGDLDEKLSYLLLERKLTNKDFARYIDAIQWLGFATSHFLNASLSYNLIVPPDEVIEMKKELVEKNKEKLENGDVIASSKVEGTLIDKAKELTNDVPDRQLYDSGCSGTFNNNYKNVSLMRGAIKNLADSNKVKISTASLVEGIPPEDFAQFADLITQASYSRAIGCLI